MSDVCKGCHSFQVFGEKCWFFWQSKKQCSQFKRSPEDEPHYFAIEMREEQA